MGTNCNFSKSLIMKKTILIFILISFKIIAQTNDSIKTNSLPLFHNKNIFIDFKAIDPEKGYFGIDYKLSLERNLLNIDSIKQSKLKIGINSQGFITVAGDKNKNNSIINEVKVEAFPLLNSKPKVNSKDYKNWEDALNDPNLSQKASEMAKQASSPFWLFLDIHAKHETTQDFKNYDFAFGTNLSFSTSILSSILDYPFKLLRTSNYNNPRYLDVSIGYDFVTGLNKTQYVKDKDDVNHMNRLNLMAEWETGIFTENERIGFLLNMYYNLDNPTHITQNYNGWNYFYMIRFDHIISNNSKTTTKLSIKYTEGALPPNYNKGYIIGGGFSFEF